MTVLSVSVKRETPTEPHFIPSTRSFQIELPLSPLAPSSESDDPRFRSASTSSKPKPTRYYTARPRVKPRLNLTPFVLPVLEMQHPAPAQNDFYVTLGTSIVDPEKDANWTNAAIYPQVPTSRALPVMRVIGQSARSIDHIQVAPGFFWWASSSCCVSVSVPMRLTGTASDWGVLLALNY